MFQGATGSGSFFLTHFVVIRLWILLSILRSKIALIERTQDLKLLSEKFKGASMFRLFHSTIILIYTDTFLKPMAEIKRERYLPEGFF